MAQGGAYSITKRYGNCAWEVGLPPGARGSRFATPREQLSQTATCKWLGSVTPMKSNIPAYLP